MGFLKKHKAFLADVLILAFTSFGGAQAHIGYFQRLFVEKRKDITPQELTEYMALANLLPGPASTQTLTAISYKIGGLWLALLTLALWILPSALLMTLAAVFINYLEGQNGLIHYFRFVFPVAVALVGHSAITISQNAIKDQKQAIIAVIALVLSLIFPTAYTFPAILVAAIIGSIFIFNAKGSHQNSRILLKIKNVILIFVILMFFALLGALVSRTSYYSLPIRLFENFFRNGGIVFGGGQVLVPLMFTEFVEMKRYLSQSEFLAGYSLLQVLPGPTFSFSAFIGGMAMKNIEGQWLMVGSMVAVVAINLPGFIIMVNILKFWQSVKNLSVIKNITMGISAVAVGFVAASFVLLMQKGQFSFYEVALSIAAMILLFFFKNIAPYWLIIGAICIGVAV